MQTLLESALELPLQLHCGIKLDRPLQCEFGINKITALLACEFASQLQLHMQQRSSYLSPRDRDFGVDPLLVGGSDPDLAGQASPEYMNARLAIFNSSITDRPSDLSPRDRDICVDPLLVGESDMDLAGQASPDCTKTRLAIFNTSITEFALCVQLNWRQQVAQP